MKKIAIIFSALVFMAGICQSQTSDRTVTGKYIGIFVNEYYVTTINVKANHKFIITKYKFGRKIEKTVYGNWIVDGDKLVLTEKSGTITVLQMHNDTWYVASENGYSVVAKFFKNNTAVEFAGRLRKYPHQQGC